MTTHYRYPIFRKFFLFEIGKTEFCIVCIFLLHATVSVAQSEAEKVAGIRESIKAVYVDFLNLRQRADMLISFETSTSSAFVNDSKNRAEQITTLLQGNAISEQTTREALAGTQEKFLDASTYGALSERMVLHVRWDAPKIIAELLEGSATLIDKTVHTRHPYKLVSDGRTQFRSRSASPPLPAQVVLDVANIADPPDVSRAFSVLTKINDEPLAEFFEHAFVDPTIKVDGDRTVLRATRRVTPYPGITQSWEYIAEFDSSKSLLKSIEVFIKDSDREPFLYLKKVFSYCNINGFEMPAFADEQKFNRAIDDSIYLDTYQKVTIEWGKLFGAIPDSEFKIELKRGTDFIDNITGQSSVIGGGVETLNQLADKIQGDEK